MGKSQIVLAPFYDFLLQVSLDSQQTVALGLAFLNLEKQPLVFPFEGQKPLSAQLNLS
jgi:hypothetical protein